MPAFIEREKSREVNALKLKEMSLHEMIDLGRVHILRVWGGWIYYIFKGSEVISAVYVPQTSSQE